MPAPKDPIKYKKWKEGISKARIGKPAWNKGLTKEMDSRLDYERPTQFRKETNKGKDNFFYGKHHTEQTKEKNRLAHLGRHFSPKTEFKKGDLKLIGSNNCNWHNGASFELYGREFNNKLKEQIRKRGLYICQLCSSPQNGRKLDIHHIDYDKKNNDTTNLIPLCLKCHRLTNHNREHWTKYFQEKISIKTK